MKRLARAVVAQIAGAILTSLSCPILFFAGWAMQGDLLPYPDPTPAQQAAQAADIARSQLMFGVGCAMAVTGMSMAFVASRRARPPQGRSARA